MLMTLNKATLNSATGQHMVNIILKLMSVVDADVIELDKQLQYDVDNLIVTVNEANNKYELF